ncbi:uncharacterized protein LOC108745062 isoform X2 [Agrilus planipennis]|uniref:Uncharacterized protein LOC108745062 isoform X2 n=1 Tax=Agrilus planipennis TaxID=224129 RepID=A0A1W4XV02_AGRPL|nr:uncharacterized protein LOC108745062 isoform X2 [Agrilus planipennis]
MAYVNVKDWSTEQVTDWLKGLDSSVAPYIKSFLNNEVKGHQLLSLRSDDLEHLGVLTLGHQEIILEAVEHLRNFHYELDRENLQMLALKLSCAANSLSKSLPITDDDCKMVPTQIMSDVHTVIQAAKPLVCWLDRSPFYGDKTYMDIKSQLLQLAFEMATSAHRDIFSEKPLKTIRNISESLAQLADNIIQDICDPMILQTAFLALATLKKKEQELGFFLVSSCNAAHQIAEIKYGSPAHVSTKIEEGDEIVQVNYQTVVGWQRKKVLLVLQESPPEIVLTLKKRPRHTKVYGQIYMKPYRLPSKKRAIPYSRWNDNLPSPQLLAIHDLPPIPMPRPPPTTENTELELESSSSSDSEPLDSPLVGTGRVYPLKPRPVLQRRHTITGASPISKRPYQAFEQYWQLWKNQASSYNIDSNKLDEETAFLRDKSASCSYGLELGARPSTVLGISQNKDLKGNLNNFRKCLQEKPFSSKRVNFEDNMKIIYDETDTKRNQLGHASLGTMPNSVSVTSLSSLSESLDFIDESDDITDRSKMKNEWQKEIVEEIIDSIGERQKTMDKIYQEVSKPKQDDSLAEVHVHSIIKKFDQKFLPSEPPQPPAKPKIMPRSLLEKPPDVQKKDWVKKPAVPPRNISNKVRGTLNKSHSTPAYDLTEESPQTTKSVVEPKLPDITEKNEDKPGKRESFYDVSGLSNTNIKYELGIPLIEPKNIEITPGKLDESSAETSPEVKHEIKKDVPPKPPPRSSATTLTYKPRYPDPIAPKPRKLSDNADDKNCTLDKMNKDYEMHGALKSNHQNYLNSQQFFHTQEIPKIEIDPPQKTSLTSEVSVPFSKITETSPVIKIDTHKTDTHKSHDTKVSPTNSVVRAFYSSKHKANKKKNSLVAKRRKVSVKDVSPGELSGYLCQRLRSKHSQNVHWEKRWFVLSCDNLYGFKNKDSTKADCLIFLSDYTVSVATEVKSRANAFKVYHTGTVFYFSAENSEMLTMWMDELSTATLHNDPCKDTVLGLYSETDDSDSEQKNTEFTISKPTESFKKFGSLKKLTPTKTFSTSQCGSSSLDRKWFFNKSNSSNRTPQPVPTEQFRSFRKMSSTSTTESVSTGNFTSHVPNFSPKYQNENAVQSQNNNDSLAGFVTLEELMNRQREDQKLNPTFHENINANLIQPDVVYGEISIRPKEDYHTVEKKKEEESVGILHDSSKKKISRTTSESSDTEVPKENLKCIVESPNQANETTSFCFGKRGSLKKRKSKKEAHYSEVYGGDDSFKSSWPSRSKDSNKFLCADSRMIQSEFSFANRKLLKNKEYSASATNLDQSSMEALNELENAGVKLPKSESGKKFKKVVKQHSFNSDRKAVTKPFASGDCREKFWIDSLRKTDKVCDKNSSKVKLKSAVQYTPMSLPLASDQRGKLNAKFAFELNLNEKGTKVGKSKGFFSKQADGKKEKTFLGSPKLHRAVFGKNKAIDHSHSFDSAELHSTTFLDNYVMKETVEEVSALSSPSHIFPSADYPGLEYPPTFEPETYSLADPNSNISLLRKQERLKKEKDNGTANG